MTVWGWGPLVVMGFLSPMKFMDPRLRKRGTDPPPRITVRVSVVLRFLKGFRSSSSPVLRSQKNVWKEAGRGGSMGTRTGLGSGCRIVNWKQPR